MVRQVALMLQADRCARRAQSGSDSSPFSSFLGPAVSSSAPGTLQGLKTAFVPAALLGLGIGPESSCFTSSYTAWTIRGSMTHLEKVTAPTNINFPSKHQA